MKFSKEQLKTIFDQAYNAGLVAGQSQLATLKAAGPKYQIGSSQMLDLCGIANCLIPKRVISMRSKAVKELVNENIISNWDYHGGLCLRLPIVGQEMSVREATVEAAISVLKSHNIDAYMISNLD